MSDVLLFILINVSAWSVAGTFAVITTAAAAPKQKVSTLVYDRGHIWLVAMSGPGVWIIYVYTAIRMARKRSLNNN